jgi:hypothetical protein
MRTVAPSGMPATASSVPGTIAAALMARLRCPTGAGTAG